MGKVNYKEFKIAKSILQESNNWIKLLYILYRLKEVDDIKFKPYFSSVFKELNKYLNLSLVSFFNKKLLFLNSKLFIFISHTDHFIGYKHNSNVMSLNNSIYFFNMNKLLFVLTQFSMFLYKIIYLRGQILLVNLDNTYRKDLNIISYVTNQYILNGKWIFGLWTNWSYFYKKLWEYENLILKSFQYNKSIKNLISNNKYFGLIGLRYIPDFIFFFSNKDLFSYSNLVKESFNFHIPMGGILANFSDSRFINYPLYGDITNNFNYNFYKLLYLKLVKLSIIKRFIKFNL